MIANVDVSSTLVLNGMRGQCYGTLVVATNDRGTSQILAQSWGQEPGSKGFLGSVRCGHILGLCSTLSHGLLFDRAPADCSPMQDIHISHSGAGGVMVTSPASIRISM